MAEDYASIKLRHLIIKDAYKEKYLKERETEKENLKKNRKEVLERSARRFCNSPFAVNYIGLDEISEIRQKHRTRIIKPNKAHKSRRNISENKDDKLLKKLRVEVKNIETNERKLKAALKSNRENNENHLPKLTRYSRFYDSISVDSREKSNYSALPV